MILLEKNLMVLEEGVLEGRKVFVNILKYIRMGASSNFGNMFSVIGASAWLPYRADGAHPGAHQQPALRFLPGAIPTDNVGPQQIAKPRPWNMGEIAKFIVFIGPISSIFDYTTYAMMWFVFKCNQLGLVPPPELAARFAERRRPGTNLRRRVVPHRLVCRIADDADAHHPRHPHQPDSVHPIARQLATHHDHAPHHGIGRLSALFAARDLLGFVPLPPLYWLLLLVTLLCYVGLTQLAKVWLLRKSWI